MKIEMNIEKKHLYVLAILIVIVSSVSVFAAWDSSKPSHQTLYTDRIEAKTANGNLGMIFNKVGIGTTSPTVKLDIVGDIKASGNVYANGKKLMDTSRGGTLQNLLASAVCLAKTTTLNAGTPVAGPSITGNSGNQKCATIGKVCYFAIGEINEGGMSGLTCNYGVGNPNFYACCK